MKYKELIQFDPITTVVQLTDSSNSSKAKHLVETYVISETMQAQLSEIVFPQLDLGNTGEHKGMLIVGNYGTGKSHLMSFISAVASDAHMVDFIGNPEVKTAAGTIAGKFDVLPTEIGGVETPFRTILVSILQGHLNKVGVDYVIPSDDTSITNNKEWMAAMMDAYHAKFPGKGILVIIDEMLDYLRALQEKSLVLALGVMRELGEFANARDAAGKPYGLHFIGGVQEAIFDSGRFAFVSDSLGRVAERFRQVKIDRADVQYVISERLLKKSAEQMGMVESHLAKFTKCYEDLAPRMGLFKRMFPVHPDFLATFEKMHCVEKRRILDTLSAKMSALLENDVPENEPGLIAFDSYWADVKKDSTSRTNSDTKSVINSVAQLESKIDQGGLSKMYVPIAHRLVNALAVHRLSQDAIDTQMGLTAKELREQLFVYDDDCATEENPAEALQEQIQVVMKKLMAAVDGQYISRNVNNDQYYIDVKKIVDVEQLIEKRAESLDPERLDRAYFDAIGHLMEVTDVPAYCTGFKIWEYSDIRWFSHKTFRRGYLFFGAPNERSTAQPPRDYYIYFLHPFGSVAFQDEKKSDEVFFRLDNVDADFKKQVAAYAGAIELRDTNTGALKNAFDNRAANILSTKIIPWINSKGLDAFSVTYKGVKKKATAWIHGVDLRDLMGIGPNETLNFRDRVHAVCGYLLEACFHEQAKEYPVFSKYLSAEARNGAIKDSLRLIAGSGTKQGVVLLDGLKLLDGTGSVAVSDSPYAEKVMKMLDDAGPGKVVNRSELIVNQEGRNWFDPEKSRLEPELLILLLAALVYAGRIVLSIPGKTFAATALGELANADIADLVEFSHISRPQAGNAEGVEAVIRLFKLPPGLASQISMLKSDPVTKLQTAVSERIQMAAPLISRLGHGVTFLGIDLLDTCHLPDAMQRVKAAKDLLEKIRNFDTPAKLLAMPLSKAEVDAQNGNVALIAALDVLVKFCYDHIAVVDYFDKAAADCPDDDTWRAEKKSTFEAIRTDIVQADTIEKLTPILKSAEQKFKQLEDNWVAHYTALHGNARLSENDDLKKQQVKNSVTLKKLTDLAAIDIIPKSELDQLQAQINAMVVCGDCNPQHLHQTRICTSCHYSPKNDGTGTNASAALAQMPQLLDALLAKWTALILENLPKVSDQFELLSSGERSEVEGMMSSGKLPSTISSVLLSGLKKALGGLEKIVVNTSEIANRLMALGPCEAPKVERAVLDFFADKTNGHDLAKVRIVFEQ